MDTALAVVALDFDSSIFQTDPWPLYKWFRGHAPVVWSDRYECYFTFGYAEVREVLTSRSFSAFHPFRVSRRAFGKTMLDSADEEHRRLRTAVSANFHRRSVADLRHGLFAPTIADVLDRRLRRGEAFDHEISVEIAYRNVCSFLGLDPDNWRELSTAMRPLIDYVDYGNVSLQQVQKARAHLSERISQVIQSGVSDSCLLKVMTHSDELSSSEVRDAGILLLAAGTETTIGAMSTVTSLLAHQPALWKVVLNQPALIGPLVGESVRFEPPLHMTLRFAQRDVELAGTPIPEGAPVQACLASANRDESVFSNPDDFDLARRDGVALTFGLGEHVCLGAGFASAEVELFVTGLVQRLDSLTWMADSPPRTAGRTFRAVRSGVIACS